MKMDHESDFGIEAALEAFAAQNNLAWNRKADPPDHGKGLAPVSAPVLNTLYPQAPDDPEVAFVDGALAAFAGTPLRAKIELLLGFAAGQYPVETHWPLVGQVFDELSSVASFQDQDMTAIALAISTAYLDRLNLDQRGVVRDYFFGDAFSVLRHCVHEWQILVLAKTLGQVETVYPAGGVRIGEEIVQWLGAAPLPRFTLAVDFRPRTSSTDRPH